MNIRDKCNFVCNFETDIIVVIDEVERNTTIPFILYGKFYLLQNIY